MLAIVVVVVLGLIAASSIVAAVVVFVWNRYEGVQRDRLAQEAKRIPPDAASDPMPASLIEIIAQESEPWAREDAAKAIYERYAATRDWKKVETALLGNVFGQPWGNA